MTNSVRETLKNEIEIAIVNNELANTEYHQAIKRLLSFKIADPDSGTSGAILKEIDEAWLKKDRSEKSLRRAYMKLFGSCFKN
jgi:superoxide dismutase